MVGQVDLPAGGAILARDVGGEHVGRLGVARRLVVGRLPAALALVALEVTLLVLLAALFLD